MGPEGLRGEGLDAPVRGDAAVPADFATTTTVVPCSRQLFSAAIFL